MNTLMFYPGGADNFGGWVESSVPEEHFIGMLPLEKPNAGSIYSALVEYCREMTFS